MMKNCRFTPNAPKLMLLAVFLASGIFIATGYTRAGQASEKPPVPASLAPSPAPASGLHPLPSAALLPKAKLYYQAMWGVDILGVKAVESGLMLRFSYLVLDAKKAAVLNDKKNNPLLIDVKSGAQLVIPTLEKVGQLRQSSTPENGMRYWMLFSNKGTLVKPGDLVDIEIGTFRAHGLVVQ